jgi:hypothetical protein
VRDGSAGDGFTVRNVTVAVLLKWGAAVPVAPGSANEGRQTFRSVVPSPFSHDDPSRRPVTDRFKSKQPWTHHDRTRRGERPVDTSYRSVMSILKSLRDRFVRAISKGEVELDPDEVVQAGSVGSTQGPIVVAKLDELGIRATTLDHRVGGDAMGARTKVMVLRRDHERAAAFIAEFTREYPSRNVIDY